ncbi:MAG: sulfite exporter TauE/SafE family protein, partial [Variovorax sp.]
MQSALLATAFVMGLAGGPHCVAMCGAACASVIRIVRAPAGGVAALQSPGRSLPAGAL